MGKEILLKLGGQILSVNVGENILGSIKSFLLEAKIRKPLYYQNPGKWFYPAGTIVLVEKDEVIEFQMDGTTVFEFPSATTEIELHFKAEVMDHQNSIFASMASNSVTLRLYDSATKSTELCTAHVFQWKHKVKDILKNATNLYWHFNENDVVRKERIYLTKQDVPATHRDSIQDLTNENVEFYMLESDNSISIQQAQSFMYLSGLLPANSSTALASKNLDVLITSFASAISSTGQDSLDFLKASILSRFKDWKKSGNKYYAPISSLSQGSGSGKSKLTVEAIKDGPGFYIVFRADDSSNPSGYPQKNKLSNLLKDLLHVTESFGNLTEAQYLNSLIEKILLFFAKIITAVLNELVFRASTFYENARTESIDVLLKSAFADIGSMFEKNGIINCEMLISQYWENTVIAQVSSILSIEPHESITAAHISSYIKRILEDPKLAISKNPEAIDSEIYEELKCCLEAFPFLFVLDEADELDDQKKVKTTPSSMQILRRALSKLESGTNVFFLTLGTKSDVHDLNPPLAENSMREIPIAETFPPIILLSNTSIFAKTKLPIDKVVIDQSTLTNPVMFKYLATLGHPLWTSVPLNDVVSLARAKLLNGSASTFKYVLVIWMIRAGMMANPTDLNTRSLIASHMATLFDLSPDLIKMLVFYPSEPVLAMACRQIIKEDLMDKLKIQELFEKLDEFFEAVKLDQGNLVEVIGSMFVLLAIDQATGSERLCSSSSDLDPLIEEMECKMPDFKWLWNKKRFILEPENASNAGLCVNFTYYHVVTVKNFLKKLLDGKNFEDIERDLPEVTLNGILNASHAVKVVRTGKDGFKFGDTTFQPLTLPVADDRISDRYCNLIDDSMLKLGLAQQCMFLMPDNYFAYDLVIPLVLEDGTASFIGVQFKSRSNEIAKVVQGMPARFHYVKCPQAGSQDHECFRCNPAMRKPHEDDECSCNSCIEFNKLAALYANQITLVISLEDLSRASNFSASFATLLSPSNTNLHKQELKHCLKATWNEAESILKSFKTDSKDFFKPLIENRRSFCNESSMLLSSCLWRDLNLSNAEETSSESLETATVRPDPFIHRQHCIFVRGIDNFKHLFLRSSSYNAEENNKCAELALKSAKSIVSNYPHFFQRFDDFNSTMRKLSMLKAIMYDARINYLELNYELARMRGFVGDEKNIPKNDFGYPKLLEAAKNYYTSQADELKESNDSRLAKWLNINSSEWPSKNPSEFQRLLKPGFQPLFYVDPTKDLHANSLVTSSSSGSSSSLASSSSLTNESDESSSDEEPRTKKLKRK